MTQTTSLLVLACGALAHEIMAVIRANRWQHVAVQCLPAELHNRPQRIPEAVRRKIRAARPHYARIFVAYGDCGSGGLLDKVLAEEGVERLPGAHCYEFFAGADRFATLAEREPGTFYLTDFLARHFERLIWQGLGLDRHPELLPIYFGNYRKLVYLAQTRQPALMERAQTVAARLGLAFEQHNTDYGDLERVLVQQAGATRQWAN